ncbi:MAG: hypothetical protein ACE141_13055 [Bryobacteraceae bacterium]
MPNYLDIERRPLKHWNVDGLPELLVGLLWLAMAGAFALGPSRGVFWLVVPPVLVAAVLAANWLLRRLKERITYPRAGYAQPGAPARKVVWVAVAAALPASYIGYYAVRRAVLPLEWMFLALGVICMIGGSVRLWRFLRDNPE